MVQVQVPKAFHRVIIGKQGCNIKLLSTTFGTSVKVPQAEDPSTTVAFEGGREAEALAFVEEKLGFKLSDEPLICSHTELSLAEAKHLFDGHKLQEFSTKYGLGIRLPTEEDPHLLVQGRAENVEHFISEVGLHLGRTQVPAKTTPKTYGSQKENLSHGKIAEVLFFAGGEADDAADEDRFVQLLRSGNKTLDICVFTITSNRIANAIKAEFRDGVKVRIITDNNTIDSQGSDIRDLAAAGIPVKMDVLDGHMHHKFAVIDNQLLLNGSFNWTRGASTLNYENVMATNDPIFVREFAHEFERLWNNHEQFVSI